MEKPLRLARWGTELHLSEGDGGFSVRGCPNALALAEQIETAVNGYAMQRAAALKLYLSGHWVRIGPSSDEDAAVWEEFRNAFGIEPGTATAQDVGATPAATP